MTSRLAAPEKSLVRVYVWIIALVTLLTVGVALVVALERPVTYTAESRIEVLSVPTRGAPIAPNMGTEREVATSGSVAEDAAARLDSSRSAAVQGLKVSVVADTSVLVIDYSASSAEEAYSGAEAFTHSYVATRNAEQKVRVASVISSPGVPEAGGSTDYVLIVAIGLLVGLALGIGAAWLWDRVSDRVRSPRELEKAGPPRVVSAVSLPSDGVAMSGDGRDFAFLASRLSSMTGGRREGVRILVTAPRRRSGASTVAINTAAAIAGLGRRVVLVDADLSSRGSELAASRAAPTRASRRCWTARPASRRRCAPPGCRTCGCCRPPAPVPWAGWTSTACSSRWDSWPRATSSSSTHRRC